MLTAFKLIMGMTSNIGGYWLMHEISTQTKCLQKALSGQLLSVNNRPAFRLASISSEAVSFEGQGPKTHCSELILIN